MYDKTSGVKGGMIDNRKVKDDHQQGIERVKQREPMPTGQGGKMNQKGGSGDFKRGGSTPRPA
jgi:hypothetical protein